MNTVSTMSKSRISNVEKTTMNMNLAIRRVLRRGRVWALAAAALAMAMPALAVDPVPHIKALVHPAVPRDGRRGQVEGEYEGDLRTKFETTVETYWKEISYHESDANTGEATHGFYMDTKTLGYVDLPWPCYPTGSNAVSPLSWVNIYDPAVLSKAERIVTFGGEHNWETGNPTTGKDGQLYGGSGPLVDLVWTPGERFFDEDGNGQFTPGSNVTIRGEAWWDSDNTNALPRNWPGPLEIARYHGSNGAPPDTRGELYADYDGGTVTNVVNGVLRVTRVDFDAVATIFIADGQSNAVVNLSELDLTPNNNLTAASQPSEEGDFAHRHVLDPVTGGTPTDIPRNGRFDYQIDGLDVPLVFPARSATDSNAVLTLSYKRWMLVSTNSESLVYQGTQAGFDGAVQVDVVVPVYQSYELYGVRDGNVFAGSAAAWVQGIITNTLDEPFEDFISWWLPHAGTNQSGLWLGGVTGGPVAEVNMPLRTAHNAISWGAYTNYIANNYPGDVALLTARAGNGRYDGPDNWLDKVDNKMQQKAFLNGGYTVTPAPGAFWDPRRWYGGSWTQWWASTFGSMAPPWEERISICEPFVPSPRVAGGWFPPVDSTWGYDGPREFADLASSLYHNSGNGDRDGDLRLGEVTSPFSQSIHGQDIGDNNPDNPNQRPDQQIVAGGPLAFGGVGVFGYDARNVQNLELLTWRRDGQSLTGPKNSGFSQGNLLAKISYGGDHRDRTLDGLIDQGETVPANSHCYYVDDHSKTLDGGFTLPVPFGCVYPFNWNRYAQDCIAINDLVENYVQNSAYGPEPIDEPLSWPATAYYGAAGRLQPNVLGRVGRFPPHNQYARGDTIWVEEIVDGLYNTDEILAAQGGIIPFGEPGAPLNGIYYQDLNGTNGFELAADNVWLDTLVTNGLFDAEMLIEGDGIMLTNGTVGQAYADLHPDVRIVCAPSVGPDFQFGDPIWLEEIASLDSNAVAMAFDSSDTQILTWSFIPYGTPATLVITNALSGVSALGGVATWLDANGNGAFDADDVLVQNSPLVDFIGGPALYPGTVGITLTNALIFDRPPVGYNPGEDDVWLANYGSTNFFKELVLSGFAQADRTTNSFAIPNLRYLDADGSLTLTRARFGSTNATEFAWVDTTPDGRFAVNRSRHLPLYFIGLHNDIPIGVDLAGNKFSCLTMDADYFIGGMIQVVPTSLGPLHHEMGHDIHLWPDLYDYDRFLPNGFKNGPISAFDLMGEGTIVHGTPDLKGSWIEPVDLAQLLPRGGGIQRLFLYPCERNRDQYYTLANPARPGEKFWFWYQSGKQANPFANFAGPGMQGLHIQHNDTGTTAGFPLLQRHNNHYSLEIVQADGRYDLQDGVNSGGPDDVWPGTTSNRIFTADSIPQARWWDQSDIGLRIHDVILPTDDSGPLELRVEYYDPSTPWTWPADGADVDGDGIPDVWEYHYFGGITTAGPGTDWDLDGLSDLGEYLADTDPAAPGSNDGAKDKDGDGISNADEVNIYGTDPRLPDTDDDGLPDGAELRWQLAYGANPTNSLLPLRSYAALFGGTTNDYLSLPDDLGNTRFALNAWTLEARVAGTVPWSNAVGVLRYRILPDVLTNTVFGSVLVERRVGIGEDTFVLGVDRSGRPVAGFGATDASWVTALTNMPSDGGTWTWLAATYDPSGQILRLYVNGIERATLPTGGRTPSVTGTGPNLQRIGTGLQGMLDEVRIWDRALTAAQVLTNRTFGVTGREDGLVALYRFDDNTSFEVGARGTSLVDDWQTGQVEDFSDDFIRNWHGGWREGATMHGSISHVPTNAGVVSVSSTNANGAYGTGQTLELTVRFSTRVTVTGGSPFLQLEVGQPGSFGVASYLGGSGTDTLRFRYTVQPQDWSADLDYASPSALVANGATVRDPAARNASLALPLPSGVGSLGWNKDIGLYELPFINGMEVTWLEENFPGQDPSTINPNGDPDGDGMTTYEEYLAGTDPNDRNSLLRIRSVAHTPANNTFTVNWQATPGKRYDLHYTGTLLGNAWTNPPGWSGIEAAFDNMSITDGQGLTPWPATQRFYRATLQP